MLFELYRIVRADHLVYVRDMVLYSVCNDTKIIYEGGKMKTRLVPIEVEFLKETKNSILVWDGVKKVWLPKKITYYGDSKICLLDTGSACLKPPVQLLFLKIPEWLAYEKGLI